MLALPQPTEDKQTTAAERAAKPTELVGKFQAEKFKTLRIAIDLMKELSGEVAALADTIRW